MEIHQLDTYSYCWERKWQESVFIEIEGDLQEIEITRDNIQKRVPKKKLEKEKHVMDWRKKVKAPKTF